MSALKVGDSAEVLWVHQERNKRWVGKTLLVKRIYVDKKNCQRAETFPAAPAINDWKAEQLRRIDPPSKSDPVTDFAPCDGEFLEDLKRQMGKVRV